MKKIDLPPRKLLDTKVANNSVVQFDSVNEIHEVEIEKYKRGSVEGFVLSGNHTEPILVVNKRTSTKAFENIILADVQSEQNLESLKNGQWLKHSSFSSSLAVDELENRVSAVRDSWLGQFSFEEEREEDGVNLPGLRSPQIGALYAALAHWTVTENVGTVVMPTGTGKTETMLALLVKQRPERLLVIAPTNALRTQIAEKFYHLGLLKRFGVVGFASCRKDEKGLQDRLGREKPSQKL